MELTDKVAVVTGAGSGIGRGIALAMAGRGARVAAVDLDAGSAAETARLLMGAGGKGMGLQADTSRAAEVDRAVSAAVSQLGPLDIMVNNAGILDGYWNVDETDDAVWQRVLGINLTGVFHGCKRALREMLPRGRGRIVNMASVAGLNRQMAVTYSARGITINAVAPGPILTGLRAHSQEILGPGVPDMSGRGVAVDDAAVRAIAPVGRRGTVEEIASAVCFLASDEAGYITGHTLVVDGGWRAK